MPEICTMTNVLFASPAFAAKAKSATSGMSLSDQMAATSTAEYIIYGALFLIVVSLLVTQGLAIYRRIQSRKGSQSRVLTMLQEAREQGQRFEVQSQVAGKRHYMGAVLREIGKDRLFYETVGEGELPGINTQVEVYFRLREEGSGTVYHKFVATVRSVVVLGPKRARIEVSMPTGMQLGQKRSFYRVKPVPRSVRVVALWHQPEDAPLPMTTSEIGQPLFSFTNPSELLEPVPSEEEEDASAKKPATPEPQPEPPATPVEDISGSGIGLRLPRPENLEALETGMHLLCLLVYNESTTEANLVRFWCLGKLVNIREPKDDPDSVVFGMEFSHWAILEPNSKEINWFPHTPASGVGPITQWVIKQDLEQNRRS